MADLQRFMTWSLGDCEAHFVTAEGAKQAAIIHALGRMLVGGGSRVVLVAESAGPSIVRHKVTVKVTVEPS